MTDHDFVGIDNIVEWHQHDAGVDTAAAVGAGDLHDEKPTQANSSAIDHRSLVLCLYADVGMCSGCY